MRVVWLTEISVFEKHPEVRLPRKRSKIQSTETQQKKKKEEQNIFISFLYLNPGLGLPPNLGRLNDEEAALGKT